MLARIEGTEQRLVTELARHTQAIHEAMKAQISVIDEKHADLPARVSQLEIRGADLPQRVIRLETKVFARKKR